MIPRQRPAAGRRARPFLSRKRVARLGRVLLSGVVLSAILALVVFHIWLFWGQWQSGRLAEPLALAKWAGSACLLVALFVLWRYGLPLVFGRQALVVWLLAALVHVGAGPPAAPALASTASPALVFIAPTIVGAVLVASVLLAGAGRARRRIRRGTAAIIGVEQAPIRIALVLAGLHGLRAPPPQLA